MTVAVLDTGVDVRHPDLDDNAAAAGNCGDDEDPDKDGIPNWQEDGCSEHNAKRRPALYPDAIAVAAVNHDATRSSFSTANEHVDIAAPGGERRPGRAILSTDRCTHVGSPSNLALQCGTTTKFGTSMAAPFVAGVVAHMLNRHPQATVGEVRRALEATVAAPPAPVDKKKYPEGSWTRRGRINDPPAAPPSREYGFGMVDPAEAVARLGEIVAGVEAADAGGFEAVAAGGRFSCGLRTGGEVVCWGDNAGHCGMPCWIRPEGSSPRSQWAPTTPARSAWTAPWPAGETTATDPASRTRVIPDASTDDPRPDGLVRQPAGPGPRLVVRR